MRWYNLKSCFRGLMDKALASEASHVGSSPTGNICYLTRPVVIQGACNEQ